MISFWQLPGPLRFLESLMGDLRSGKNVVACFPREVGETTDSPEPVIRRSLDHDLAWISVDTADGPLRSPVDLLFDIFLPQSTPGQVRNALALVHEDKFTGRLVHLRNLSSGNWPAWRDFLSSYETACRTRSVLERSVFLAIIDPVCGRTPVQEDVCLAVHQWEGAVDDLDLLLYASAAFSGTRLKKWERRLAAYIGARLALWDPEVCDRLRRQSLDVFLHPQDLLAEIACDRGWSVADAAPANQLRDKGILQTFQGTLQTHSAFVVISGDKQELKRRLWGAEVETLFPLIELQRQRLIEQLLPFLSVPYTTPFGVIDDARDLELGHIADQLYSSRTPEHFEMRGFAQWLKRLRDRLAHSEPIPADLLLQPRFVSILDVLEP